MIKTVTVVQFQSIWNMLSIKAPRSGEPSGTVIEEAPRPEWELNGTFRR